jgi:hypothetical protein
MEKIMMSQEYLLILYSSKVDVELVLHGELPQIKKYFEEEYANEGTSADIIVGETLERLLLGDECDDYVLIPVEKLIEAEPRVSIRWKRYFFAECSKEGGGVHCFYSSIEEAKFSFEELVNRIENGEVESGFLYDTIEGRIVDSV